MKKAAQDILIKFSPIIILVGQLVANAMYFFVPEIYFSYYHILSGCVGLCLICALQMVAVSYKFKFCYVGRAAAWTQVGFVLLYMIIPGEELYNIVVQIIVGAAAGFLTIIHIAKEEPQWRQAI